MNRSAASRASRHHSPAFFSAVDHSAVSTLNTQGECSFRSSLGGSELPKVYDYTSMPSLKLSARSRVLPTSHRPEHYRTGQSLLASPRHGRRKKEPPFTDDGRSDAPATKERHFEGLRVREGGVVGTNSALAANGSQEGLVVSRSKIGKVFRPEGPRHTPTHAPVLQGLNSPRPLASGLSE